MIDVFDAFIVLFSLSSRFHRSLNSIVSNDVRLTREERKAKQKAFRLQQPTEVDERRVVSHMRRISREGDMNDGQSYKPRRRTKEGTSSITGSDWYPSKRESRRKEVSEGLLQQVVNLQSSISSLSLSSFLSRNKLVLAGGYSSSSVQFANSDCTLHA